MPIDIQKNADKFMDEYGGGQKAKILQVYDAAYAKFDDYLAGKITEEEMAESLYDYLEVWGMTKRRAHLVGHGAAALTPAVKVLKNTKYLSLRNYDPLVSGSLSVSQYVELVMALCNELVDCLNVAFKKNRNLLSYQTLISKILLATYACIPAYDTRVKASMRSIPIPAVVSPNGLTALVKWICANADDFNAVKAKYPQYPLMKHVDAVLWIG